MTEEADKLPYSNRLGHDGDCGHSKEEHAAFDAGVMAGCDGKALSDCPYESGELREAWLAGQSVGKLSIRHAYVWLMADEEGHRYILVEDHPNPPVNALESFGYYPIPSADGWGEADRVAKEKSAELGMPIEYHSDMIDGWLASME